MKRLISLALSVVMLLALAAPAASAAETKPAPPDWVKAEEYVLFEKGEAYQKETWDRILRLRADAAAGHLAPEKGAPLYSDYEALRQSREASICFECGLLDFRYNANALAQGKTVALQNRLDSTAYNLKGQEPAHYAFRLWNARCLLLKVPDSQDLTDRGLGMFVAAMEYLLAYPDFTMEKLLDNAFLSCLSPKQLSMVKGLTFVTLDGKLVCPNRSLRDGSKWEDQIAVIRSGQTFVPLGRLAELMGAAVTLSGKKMTLERAGVTTVVSAGSKQASVGKKSVQMSSAPLLEDGRMYVPVKSLEQLLGQTVEMLPGKQQAAITENRDAVKPSNLEAWALPMGAMLGALNNADQVGTFGGKCRYGRAAVGSRVTNRLDTTGPDYARTTFKGSWDITSREDLINTVCRMTLFGHNVDFLTDAALIKSLSAAEYQQLLKNAQGMDQYMFPYTKQLSEKWGDRGILCWDLFRMSNLVQWGYLAGYVTYPEALALLEPAATLLHDNFKSWDEAYENYLDGYNWWARNNVLNQNIWETERGKIYTAMKADPAQSALFDDQLFKTPVKGVPGLTAEQVLASVQ